MGEHIRALRKNLRLTQRDLAERCGVTQQHINRIERGKTKPGADVIIKLADALGTTTDDILKNQECAAVMN